MGGLVSARRRVANQRDSSHSLPSIVGSNRGHHEKDAAGGSESGASQTHHLPGKCCLSHIVRRHLASIALLAVILA